MNQKQKEELARRIEKAYKEMVMEDCLFDALKIVEIAEQFYKEEGLSR